MIKKFLCLVCTLSLASALNAAITVIQDGQQPVKYGQGSLISVNGRAKTVVNYDKIAITVPQGQSVRLGADANGNVRLSGTNLNRILIGGSVVSADGNTVLVINPRTQVVTVREGGPAFVTTAGRTTTVVKNSSVKVAAIPDEYENNDYNDERQYNRPVVRKSNEKVATAVTSKTEMMTNEEDPMLAFLSEAERALDLPNFAAEQVIADLALESEVSPSAPTSADGN